MANATSDRTNNGGHGRNVLFLWGRLQPKGPSRAVLALARQLGALGHTVSMVCRDGSIGHVYPRDSSGRNGEHDPPICLSRALAADLRGWFSFRGLANRVRDMAPDLIHVHGARLAGVGARLARRLRKPYVLSIGDLLDPGQSVGVSRRFMRKIIVASDAVRVDLVNRIRLPRGAIQVVADGVDAARYSAQRLDGLTGDRAPVIGTIGRLAENKGQEFFIRAAYLLAMRGRDVQFVIAGEGPDRKRLQNLVTELDLVDRITFARMPVDELDVLKAVDIFVAPARRESLRLSAIEAMASGIPVVATSAGGVFSLIENRKSGVLVPKDKPDAIALAVEDLLDHPDFAMGLAASGRQVVAEQFGIEAAARNTAAVYEAALSGGTVPAPAADPEAPSADV